MHTLSHLSRVDAAPYQALRLRGLTTDPQWFRISRADESLLSLASIAERLESTHVIGAWRDSRLEGIAGLRRYDGARLHHRALLFGMYVAPEARGSGLAKQLVEAILAHAATVCELVQLTVLAGNARAVALYTRCGFEVTGREPDAVKVAPERYSDELIMQIRVAPRS